MNTASRTKKEDGMSASELLIPAAIGAGVAAAAALVLIFIVGAIVYSTSDPNKLVTGASIGILAAVSFAAGFIGSKKSGAFLPGVIGGAVFALIIFIASLISGSDSVIPTPYSYLVRLGGLALSALGALIASRQGHGRRLSSSPRKPKIKKL